MNVRGAILLGVALLAPAALRSQEGPPDPSTHLEFLRRDGGPGLEKPDPIGVGGYEIPPLDPGAGRAAGRAALTREVFGYFPYWFRSRWMQLDYGLVSTIAYFCAESGADGNITSTHGWPRYAGDPSASGDVIAMISRAHANGVRVVLCFTCFDGPSIHTLVSTPAYRENFIAQALALVRAGNAEGVNINFEGIQTASRDYLTLFMRALADSFHTQIPGSQVSCAPTDFDTRPGDWDLPALYPFVDLFFFQGYGYHYGGSSVTGPIGLLPNVSFWGSTNITTLMNTVLARISADKVLLGLPHFGYRWASVGPDPKAATKGSGVAIYYPDALGTIAVQGRQWDIPGLNPWYRYYADTSWFQGWYDDPESMGYKYQFALSRNLRGIGMWALGMDAANHDIWDVLAMYFADSTLRVPPASPVLAAVREVDGSGGTEARVEWRPNRESFLGGYRIFVSTDPAFTGVGPAMDESLLGRPDSAATLTGLSPDSTYYVRMVAIDSSFTKVSDTSDTYAVRTGPGLRYLVVDGFDRVTGSWNLGRHPFCGMLGGDIAFAGRRFDAADNDALLAGKVAAAGYAGIFWLLGDESVSDQSLSQSERAILRAYLEGGGKLFLSGSEVGYDIGRIGSPNADTSFYRNFLKSTYLGDKSASNSFTGTLGSIFEGVSGLCGVVYPEDYPDYVQPVGGGSAVLAYAGGQVAGVGFAGTFGQGTLPGSLLYLGFPVETIGSATARREIISRSLGWFEGSTGLLADPELPSGMGLLTSYPNPFNPRAWILFSLPEKSDVDLRLFDLLGREVFLIYAGPAGAGDTKVEIDGRELASGTYIVRLVTSAGRRLSHRIILAK